MNEKRSGGGNGCRHTYSISLAFLRFSRTPKFAWSLGSFHSGCVFAGVAVLLLHASAALADKAGETVDPHSALTTCLASPDLECGEVFSGRIQELEDDFGPNEWPTELFDLKAEILSAQQDLGAIEDILPKVKDSYMRDVAATAAINQARSPEDTELAIRLSRQIENSELYAKAVDELVSRTAERYGGRRAIDVLQLTKRQDVNVSQPALRTVIAALFQEGEQATAVEFALSIRATETSGALLADIVEFSLSADDPRQARTTYALIEDDFWKVTSAGRLATYLRQSVTGAEAARAELKTAADIMIRVPEPYIRFFLFEHLAQGMIEMGEIDLAVTTAREVGRFPIDHARSLRTVARLTAEHTTSDRWRAILSDSLDLLETENELDEPRAMGLADAAMTIALIGDTNWALDVLNKVSDDDLRVLTLDDMVTQLVEQSTFDPAMMLLSEQQDHDLRVNGWIALARAADLAGQCEVSQLAFHHALADVEGPDWVPLTDATVGNLAIYEASRGAFEIAEIRLRFLNEPDQRVHARTEVLEFALEHDAVAVQRRLINSINLTIAETPNPIWRFAFGRALVEKLLAADEIKHAYSSIRNVSDSTSRDSHWSKAADRLSARGKFGDAHLASLEILDKKVRHRTELIVLMRALMAHMRNAR